MKRLFKFLVAVMVLGITFMMGYVVGTMEHDRLNEVIGHAQSSFSQKSQRLETELAGLRLRMHLMNARNGLAATERDLGRRNFGSAQTDLARVQTALREAAKLASGERSEKLAGLEIALDSAIEGLGSGSDITERLRSVKSDLDALMAS